MSAEVAIQGIAQDYVTLFVGIPLLLILLFIIQKEGLRGRLVLGGVLAYFFVTYLFFLVMAMYNRYFLVYSYLMGASFFALALTLLSFDLNKIARSYDEILQLSLPVVFLYLTPYR